VCISGYLLNDWVLNFFVISGVEIYRLGPGCDRRFVRSTDDSDTKKIVPLIRAIRVIRVKLSLGNFADNIRVLRSFPFFASPRFSVNTKLCRTNTTMSINPNRAGRPCSRS